MLSLEALEIISKKNDVKTVLDLGSGIGNHSNILFDSGKEVTAVDITTRNTNLNKNIRYYQSSVEKFNRKLKKFDCVWSSHCLEHSLEPQLFLKKMNQYCKEGGYIAITVPPLKNEIVGGHVSLFNAGIILYRLVLCGLNTKEAKIKKYGYNISIILKKVSIPDNFLDNLKFDRGDIESLSEYLPLGYNFHGFNGDILELNWDKL